MKSKQTTFSKFFCLSVALLALHLMISVDATAQTKTNKYKIVIAGFNIGEMEAVQTTKGDQVNYNIHSLVEFWFFGKIRVEFLQDANYVKGQLMKAVTHSDSNRGNFVSELQWNTDHYEVDANSYKFENKEPINKPYYLSTAALYFQEPKDGDLLISENFGMPTTIREIEEGVYELKVNGSVNRFYYKDGILQQVVLENKIKNYSIKLAED